MSLSRIFDGVEYVWGGDSESVIRSVEPDVKIGDLRMLFDILMYCKSRHTYKAKQGHEVFLKGTVNWCPVIPFSVEELSYFKARMFECQQ